jgi:LacI family transcriptional regulator
VGRATYKDIAERAKVSTATVSHALKGTRHVSQEVRDAVLEAARSLEYVPNGVAAGLRRQSTRSIGFVTTELTNPVYAEMAVAAEGVLRERGYTVMISNTFNEPERERAYIEGMAERRVDGLLLTSVQVESETWRWLERLKVPFVLLNRRFADYEAPYVGVDNLGGTRSVVEYLVSLGHRRIGFIGGFAHSSSARDRYHGYLEAHGSRGLEVAPELFCEGSYDVRSGVEGAGRLFSLPEERRPTAIVAANDLTAFGVLAWAKEHGVGVPEELSVTGFDNSEMAKLNFVGLTTVKQPRKRMGEAAARMLLRQIDDGALEARSVVLPCELIVRESTGPPPGGAENLSRGVAP